MWSLDGGYKAMTPSRYKWTVIIIAMFCNFTIMDLSMVNLAIAPLARHFDASLSHVQWILTGNLLALGIAIPCCGYLADRFGMKRVILASLALFTIPSLACGLAQNLNTLIVFHVIAGLGAGPMIPLGMAMVWRVVPHEERGRFYGLTWAPAVVGGALAPVISGALVEHVSWRWIFFVNVAIGAVPFVLALAWLREQKLPTWGRFDLPGLVLAAAGFGLLLYALTDAPTRSWDDTRIIVCLIAGAAALVGFIAVELQTSEPLVDLRLFAHRGYTLNNVVLWLSADGLWGTTFLVALWLQQLQGYTPTEAGLIMIPLGVGGAIAYPIAGRIYDAHGARWVTAAGCFILAGITAAFALWKISTGAWIIALLFLARGVANSMATMPGVAAVHEVRPNEVARANALLQSARQVATSLVIALMATYLVQRTPVLIERGTRGLEPGSTAYFVAMRDAGVFTFHEAFLIVATLTVLAVVVALMLRSGRPPQIVEAEMAPAAE